MAANVIISGRYIKKWVEAWWKNWVSKNIAIALREPDRSTSHIHLRSSEIACPREGRLQSRIAAPKQRDSLSLWREAQHNSWGQPMPNRCLTDANQAYKLLMSRAEIEEETKFAKQKTCTRKTTPLGIWSTSSKMSWDCHKQKHFSHFVHGIVQEANK